MADLKLKDLRYLVAVADTRHFGRAAERSFVSQPTLSAQLKKLEEYLGVQLIERSPKRVSLNVAGRLRKQLPRLELMLYEYQTDVMLEKLHSGEIDVGILALPVPLDGLESYELYREPFTVALPAEHRLANRATIKVSDLHDETLLLLEDGHCLRDQALDICSGSAIHEKQDFRATSLETLRQMVAAGVGITLLPELAGRGAYGAARGVSIKPFAKPVPTRTIGAVWRKSTARREAILALSKLIEAHAL